MRTTTHSHVILSELLLDGSITPYPPVVRDAIKKFTTMNANNTRMHSWHEVDKRCMSIREFVENPTVKSALERTSSLYHWRSDQYPTTLRVMPYIIQNLCEMYYSGEKELAVIAAESMLHECTAKLFETDNTPQHAEHFVDCTMQFLRKQL